MITLSANGYSVSINPPLHGYSTEIHLATEIVETDTGYVFWDNGTSFDFRVLKASKHWLPTDQMQALSEFLRNAAKGRGETITIGLGSKPTGFFPFGPDKGDKGSFTTKLLSDKVSGQMFDPWRWWESELAFVMRQKPAYTLPAEIPQGSYRIGGVQGLMHPQDGYKPDRGTAYRQDISIAGSPSILDLGARGDVWTLAFTQRMNQSKAAALLNYLTMTARTTEFTMHFPAGSYPFGPDLPSGGTARVRLLDDVLECRHDNYDDFALDLRVWLQYFGSDSGVFSLSTGAYSSDAGVYSL